MTQEFKVPPVILKYKGMFDWDDLYNKMIAWFQQRDFDFYETLYKDKPPEKELSWMADRRVTGYFQYQINVEFHLWGFTTIDVVKNGKKRKMNKGRMTITFSGLVRTDWEGTWESSPWRKKLETFFNNYIYDKEINAVHLETLYYMVYNLHDKTKEYLGMSTAGSAY